MACRKSLCPSPDDPVIMPTVASQRRLRRYLDASEAANSSEFNGCVLMSLMLYADDEIWDEALKDALYTCGLNAKEDRLNQKQGANS